MNLKDGFVADSDMHVFEPADLWQKYIDPRWKHVAPQGLSEMKRDLRVKVKDHILLKMGNVRPIDIERPAGAGWRRDHETAYADSEKMNWDNKSQLIAMDKEGLDMAVMFPSRGLFVLGIDTTQIMGAAGLEDDFADAIARGYNDWMYDFCSIAPNRMFGAGMIAPHSVELAVKETRRCVEKLGFKCIFLSPGLVGRRQWHDKHYDPLWAECERLNIPVVFHGGGQNHLTPDFSLGIFDKLMMWHVFSQPLGIMATLVSLCGGGVFERFPKLRAGLLEGNCAWAPWLLHRLEEHWEWVGAHEAPDLKKSPVEYFLSNCYLSLEVDEEPGDMYVNKYGADNLVFSTDYPHGDSKYPNSLKALEKLSIDKEKLKDVVGKNWCKLYNIEPKILCPGKPGYQK